VVASRYISNKYNNRVTGIDLTEECIETGNTLSAWLKLDKHVSLHQGSALSMSFDDDSFDGAYMLHIGMNIEDKAQLFNETFRVLKPGTSLGVYDVMRNNDGELIYPVPWATNKSTSYLVEPSQYKHALEKAGFEVSKKTIVVILPLIFLKRYVKKQKPVVVHHLSNCTR